MTRLLSLILADYGPGMVAFWCPGCNSSHPIRVGPEGSGHSWGYNGDPTAPTFTPSVLFRSGHFIPDQADKRCWCDYNREQVEKGKEPSGFTCGVCHSFVTDGRIQFLGDSTHELAGQTVDLSAWPS